jgi:hypothetical protein
MFARDVLEHRVLLLPLPLLLLLKQLAPPT